MGELLNKRIVQSRTYIDDSVQTPVPDLDYDYTYPITVYEAVKRDMEDTATNLEEELDSIYRLINNKQEIIDPGTPGQLMTWTGIRGSIGSAEIVSAINTEASLRSNKKIASEKAVGDALDYKVSLQSFNSHVQDSEIHTTDVERQKWNSMAPLSKLQAHIANASMHITEEERGKWNNMANKEDFENHIYDINNPHSVTAHQIGTYTSREIDSMFADLQETFFNYMNISWDDRTYMAELVEYNAANWNPNYVLEYGDDLPDIEDDELMYFALRPATDYSTNETSDCIIYAKRPGMAWSEVGFQSMKVGDMVIMYPETTMFVWVQGRFVKLFTGNSNDEISSGEGSSTSDLMWRPVMLSDGTLAWVRSNETEAPEPMVIKGADGYAPIKGVDYDDGKDGQGVPIGGKAGELLVKLTDLNYETTWKTLSDVLSDLVISGGSLPEGVVKWNSINGKPEWYNELGDNEDGFITQKAATRQFEVLNNTISGIIEKIDGPGGLEGINQDVYDHVNDFNNPHRVTAAAIGAVTNATFIDHAMNYDNPHNVTATQIGLGKVNNTADLDKPISTATQEALDALAEKFGVISDNVEKFNYVSNVTWDKTNVTLSFIFRDKSEVEFQLPILEIFDTIYFDDVEKDLVIVLPDGRENRINIASIIRNYTGGATNSVQVVVEDGTVIKASVLPSSIGETEIAPSVHLKMSPTTTTQSVSDKSTRIATTEFVKNIVIDNLISYETDRPLSANMGRKLNETKVDVEDVIQIINDIEGLEVIDNLDSTNVLAALSANMGRYLDLTKAPRVHTSPTSSTFGRATISLFGHAKASDVDPLMDGTVFRGDDDGNYARGNHRHPTDTTRAPMHWPDVAHDQYQFTGEPRTTLPPDDSNDNRIPSTEWVRRNAFAGVKFGKCITDTDEETMVVALESTYVDKVVLLLQIGSKIAVHFKYDVIRAGTDTANNDNSARVTYLNAQGTGAYPIKFGGKNIESEMIKANHVYLFTFDGENWQLENPSGIHTLPDNDMSNSLVSSEWVRRNSFTGAHFGKCSTATSSTDKVVVLESSYVDTPVLTLQQGTSVSVTFANDAIAANRDTANNDNSAIVVKMNVQSTGLIPIKYAGKNIQSEMIKAGHTYSFTYDGTNWNLENPTAIHTLPDDDMSNSLISSEWVRRNTYTGSHYGECTTATGVSVMAVTLKSTHVNTPVLKLQKGVEVSVYFKNDVIAANTDSANTNLEDTRVIQMNVQGTGPKPIKYEGKNIVSEMIKGGRIYTFVYDDTNWNLQNPTGIHTLPDSDNSNSLVSSEWIRRNAVGVSYGKCASVTSATTKVVALESTFVTNPVLTLQKGSTVSVTFTYDAIAASNKSAGTIKMNVQNTGDHPIKFGGKDIIAEMIEAGYTYIFTFDGTNWNLENPSAIHTLPDGDYSSSLISSEWARRNIVGVFKGYCSTAKGTAAKVATLKSTYMDPVVFIRQIGITVAITFDQEDRSGNTVTTLNVNGSGAADIVFAGCKLVDGMIGKNHTHMFVFDGTYWRLLNPVPGTGMAVGDGLTIGPNGPIESVAAISEVEEINQLAGHTGITCQGNSGGIDADGKVNRVWITLNYSPKISSEVDVEFSDVEDCFAVKMGDGTLITVNEPTIISVTNSNAIVEFAMSTWYPSNSPCQLVYRTTEAWYKVVEL